jgi:hypothetical protein
MPGVAERGGGVVALAIQPCLGVGRGGMGVVLALLAMPAALGVATRRRVRRRTVFGLEALVRRPRLQQGAVHGEVLRRHVAAQLRQPHDGFEELVRDLVLQRRLRFFENVVASNAGWSMRMSKNHLNNRS